MTAKEARKLVLQRGYNEIWHNLPESIKHSIEGAVNSGHIACVVDVSLLSESVRRTLRQLGYVIQHYRGTQYCISWT